MNRYSAYYKRVPTFMLDKQLTKDTVLNAELFGCVRKGVVTDKDLEGFYMDCQGENWSPNGEAREVIQAAGCHHTSMSVGDVIVVHDDDDSVVIMWQVAPCGFKEVPKNV